VYRFYQIICFVLKNYPNFELHENMLIILWFFFLYHKYNFALNVMYITPHWHVVKDFWNLKILFNRFLIKKIQIPKIPNCECFLSVGNQLKSSQFFSHQNSIIKRVFSLVIFKIDYFCYNCCSSSKVFY